MFPEFKIQLPDNFNPFSGLSIGLLKKIRNIEMTSFILFKVVLHLSQIPPPEI
jgi:hypothetical protein